jgi:hypothetical protein
VNLITSTQPVFLRIRYNPNSNKISEFWLLFGFVCLAVPGQRGGRRHSSKLAAKLNSIISDHPANMEDVSHLQPPQQHRRNGHSSLADRVSARLEDGDVRGAIRLASSEDTFAQHTNSTYEQLRLLHPQRRHSDYAPPSPSASVNNILQLCEADIIAGIKSLPIKQSMN